MNAFNTIRCDVFLDAVAKFFPSLLHYAISCYGQSSDLKFGDYTMLSGEGAQQGDPLGPLLFCLALHELLSELKSELVLGYLDDVSLGGSVRAVIKDFLYIETKAATLGLLLNRLKCEVSLCGLTDDL